MNRTHFNQYIKSTNFRTLFNELGWDNVRNAQYDTSIAIDDLDFNLNAIAHKSGFIVYVCVIDTIPQNALCRKIDMRLRRYSNDYILIFTQDNSEHHLWVTPVKTVEKRDLVTIEYTEASKAEFLFSKLDSISFEIDEQVTIVDVTARIHQAFEVNSGKITKDFYLGFKKHHNSFVSFIKGIAIDGDKQWYASVMLNRLMFCYFIQKKGFLNFDVDYLSNKLKWVKEQRGNDQFFSSFYKSFLCVLFHGGLNNPIHNEEFKSIYGRIPYLNGGMFDEHQLEKQYQEIDIPDEAFEELFTFFDKWRWHLDTRITATGKDINPDVLGYIFEQYINDRAQMGAYYTKEDITEYIGKNCIIPFLVDEVAKTSSGKEFKSNGFVWDTLKNSGDKYIYDAVKKGVNEPLPDYIEQGIDTDSPSLFERRARWNEKAHDELALPTEIWRETIERRNRYFDVQSKIDRGEITKINDFITYNLDIRTFVYDLLATTSDHLFIKHFYLALQKVTILDPTCGSGAFLFAALNILEPLYEVCIARMEEFHAQNDKLFIDELAEIKNKYRSNIQHFVYKSIILRNLYGVDIMVEATEIAKLRLFLKMVAVVDVDRRADNLGLDPLPDIDFNIRCGNTLVGYATKAELMADITFGDMFSKAEFEDKVETEMQKVAMAYELFKTIQISQHDNIEEFKQAKDGLQRRLNELNELLNRKMYSSTASVSASHGGLTYEEWLVSHQPFHWLAEFYQIIQGNGGFDVIIGNPPYLEVRQVSYKLSNFKTLDSGAVHVYCIERSLNLLSSAGNISMIVPLALVCTQRMTLIQKLIEEKRSAWYANFAWRPAKLFDAVNRALTIFVANSQQLTNKYTTPYIKWTSENRNFLLSTTAYCCYNEKRDSFWMPKLHNTIEIHILQKVLSASCFLGHYITKKSSSKVYYRTTGGLYWKVFTNFPPRFICNGEEGSSSRETHFSVKENNHSNSLVALFSSNLFWWWYTITSNLRDLNPSDLMGLKFPEGLIECEDLQILGAQYIKDLQLNSTMLIREQKGKGRTQTQSFKINQSKPIINEIDKVLAKHYGFTEEELDFIINYDIKYRMGSELDNDTEA